jgi:HEAT repeat protein
MTDTLNSTIDAALTFLANRYKSDDILLRLRHSKYWILLNEIKIDRKMAIEVGRDMLSSNETYARFFAVSLLGQLCNPVEDGEEKDAVSIIDWLSDMLLTENSKIVIVGIANALHYPYMNSAEPALLKLSHSPDVDIRWEATVGLGSVTIDNGSKELVERLIELSRDVDPEIRNWATMHLGSIEIDSPEIRQALVDRLVDRHFDTKSEAIAALVDKEDMRSLTALKNRLASKKVGRLDIISAGSLGLPELQPYLKKWNFPTEDFEQYLVIWAIKRSDTDSKVSASVDEMWPLLDGDETYLKVLRGERPPAKYRE